jgi:hypothetical protein
MELLRLLDLELSNDESNNDDRGWDNTCGSTENKEGSFEFEMDAMKNSLNLRVFPVEMSQDQRALIIYSVQVELQNQGKMSGNFLKR